MLPTGFAAPYRTGSTASSIDIAWTPPLDPGGCVITGYAVFKDDGTGTGVFAEANSVNDLAIRDQPGLNSATITAFSPSDVGLDFVLYLEVYTEAGDTAQSEHGTITLADVPDQPVAPPYKAAPPASSGSRLLLHYDALTPSQNGGLPILSYSLEIDDGLGGEYYALTGLTVTSLATSHLMTAGVSQGLSYRLRYRAQNAYGWSEYSPTATILAAQPPEKPSTAPVIVSTSDTQISISLDLDIGNGGAAVTSYALEVNAGGLSNDAFQAVATYTSGLETHVLDLTADALAYGTIYKLRYRALNVEGAGEYSDVALVALNSLPAAPATPTRVEAASTETSITVSWGSSQLSPELEGNAITGYRLYAAREHSNIYELVYDGAGYPQVRSFVLSGLTPGEHYEFKVSAINFNGEGPQSTSPLSTYSCTAPVGVSAPVRVAATSTSTTTGLSWAEPAATGGCPLTGYALYRSDPAQADAATGAEVFVEVN